MRLININTSRLEDFSLRQKPPYAALSHRWTDNELTFNDICAPSFDSTSTSSKFQGLLQQARQHGLEYVWIDTCCIDKANSSELSEAINSMYQWYHNAQYCYVYLHDVQKSTFKDQFSKSDWFTRGWTLQELLAPRNIIFFDHLWQPLGDKQTLADTISCITGIQTEVLRTGNLDRCSIAQKMAWSANRITTRLEDQAYCLMGLFGVNMPLLYGEGNRAFIRLQEEIIRHEDDPSIFAWSMKSSLTFSGLLAPDSSCFVTSHDIVSDKFRTECEPFSMTNRGLRIKFRITPWFVDTYLALLDCSQLFISDKVAIPQSMMLGIFLRKLEENGQYIRFNHGEGGLWSAAVDGWEWNARSYQTRQLFVRQNPKLQFFDDPRLERVNGFGILKFLPPPLICIDCPRTTIDARFAKMPPGETGPVMMIDCVAGGGDLRKLALGFDFDFTPVCLLEATSRKSPLSNVALRDAFKAFIRGDPCDGWREVNATGSSVPRYFYRTIPSKPGLFAFKNQSENELEVLLSESLCKQELLLHIARVPLFGPQGSRLAWTLYLNAITGPYRDLDKQLRHGSTRGGLQDELELDMTEEDMREGDKVAARMYPRFPSNAADCFAISSDLPIHSDPETHHETEKKRKKFQQYT